MWVAVAVICLQAFFAQGKVYELAKVSIDSPKGASKEMRLAVDELKYHLKLVAGTEFVADAPLTFVFASASR